MKQHLLFVSTQSQVSSLLLQAYSFGTQTLKVKHQTAAFLTTLDPWFILVSRINDLLVNY